MDKIELKAALSVDEDGTITGTAWPFGSPDSVGDIITKGAFNAPFSDLPMLFGHNPDDLIGTWNEARETDEEIFVKGKLHMEIPRARAVRGLIQRRLVTGLSLGFLTKVATKRARGRVISALDVLEISVVRNPSHPRARITSVKSFNSALAIAEAINRATAALISKR